MSGKISFSRVMVFCAGVFLCSLSYLLGEKNGRETGVSIGYLQGQRDLALEIKSNINETIGGESNRGSYYFFNSIKDMTLYIVVKNNVKTIAFWVDEK